MTTDAKQDASPSPPQARPRLLVVDDQPINIQALHRVFQADYEVCMATSGAQALEFCRHHRLPDVILLDVLMPGMDGLQVCRRLKADPLTADIPVIFVTGLTSPEEETAALEAGGVDFISKPVNPAVVRARVRTQLTIKAQSDHLRSLAFLDGLTGIANRRRFDEALATEWRSALRCGEPLALLMIDIDHFKRYNDHYGHQAGDACLQAVARTIERHAARPHDLAARYGGEEFVCLLAGSTLAGAQAKAEALRQAVADLRQAHADSPVAPHVTVSVGVAVQLPAPGGEADALLAAADAALYQAKHAGRDRCITAPPPERYLAWERSRA
ncbi:response regulator receiver modulated diguanylate cyclase [Oryzisolibacter propanilivorax]|uniref:diguanylate cyclase n=1 Tax=Oryzisolibacter propanilivorax TaxID=1527607 RepID=A0A1G9SXR1_9BURK|nr:diguanylate cyclase [Oryzisolibacter propanilivorax]SDM40209.1 response regulator receiver modulated diguanylate cyclase [Oryzisolibacter propanilivorax]